VSLKFIEEFTKWGCPLDRGRRPVGLCFVRDGPWRPAQTRRPPYVKLCD